jgi:(p)ppGpp synthase/HD superfamily hydrolase
MRTLEGMGQGSRQRIARETLDIYAPIADRLGMNSMKHELESTTIRDKSGGQL